MEKVINGETYLTEVLIKVAGNMLHDKVVILENLPKKLLYQRTAKMIQRVDKDGYSDGTLTVDPSGATEETLYPGIEHSASGDGAYVFWTESAEALERLKAVDRYVEAILPRDARIMPRVDYAQKIGDAAANPLNYNQIPRNTLPLPAERQLPQPSPVVVPQEPPMASVGLSGRTKWTPERKAAQAEKMRQMHLNRKKVPVA